jgi:hypothetical protein
MIGCPEERGSATPAAASFRDGLDPGNDDARIEKVSHFVTLCIIVLISVKRNRMNFGAAADWWVDLVQNGRWREAEKRYSVVER